MQTATIILLGFAIVAYARSRPTDKSRPARFPHLKGWQKIFGVVAIGLTLIIVLNPEFLALGLLGDTAFFDLLVLAMSLQMYMVTARAARGCAGWLGNGVRRLGVPSPWMCYLICVMAGYSAIIVAAVQKAAHRMFS